MIKTTGFLLVFSCFVCLHGLGQSFMQSAGVTISVMHTNGTVDNGNQSLTFAFSNVTYFPKLSFAETENTSLSIGAPVSIGIGRSSNLSADGSSGLYWGFDAPMVLDFNIGAKSTRENEDKFGGYFGGGFGYSHSSWSFDGYSDFKANSYGPIIRGGVRFGFPSANLGMTIGLSYKIGLETEKFRTFGLALLLDF